MSSTSSQSASSVWRTTAIASAATIATVASTGAYYYAYGQNAYAMTPAEEGLHPIKYPWEHEKWYKTYDHQA